MREILREVGMIARALDSISNIEFKEIHLTKGQYLYLVRIYEHPGIIQEKLAEMLKVDRTTVARAVQKLERQGFILKKDDEFNKKWNRLYTTEQGDQVYAFLKREADHTDLVALDGLTKEESETLHQLLHRVRKNVEVDWDFVKKGNRRKY
ncbi:MarR family winged helix-turn-helix transcriptional regulator [Paenibacillus sp. FSL R7-0331]|uniref:MarR family winged helix-turn-helix transcriptional regulator n=1 Tax=Paenibacillus sp. FSL R7-0331 TaxID=1536773 RepID=UPI0004F60C27|nr:MarR family transcriptional regulator [Paenibacillus sp. FSL R7-0331]AIQ52133.1 MarR family transcriptional regulator [Paenibacillus sp. FSL R7-0331]